MAGISLLAHFVLCALKPAVLIFPRTETSRFPTLPWFNSLRFFILNFILVEMAGIEPASKSLIKTNLQVWPD